MGFKLQLGVIPADAKPHLPQVGGRGGGTEDWTEYFRLNPGKRDEAMAILQKVTREFDRKNGTKISKYLDDSLAKGKPPTPPPSQ